MQRTTTETTTKRAAHPKEVTRVGNDRVTKTEFDISRQTRQVGFFRAAQAHALAPAPEPDPAPVAAPAAPAAPAAAQIRRRLWRGAHGGVKTPLAMLALVSEVRLHGVDGPERRDLEAERKRIYASIQQDGRITPEMNRRIKAWNKKVDEARRA